MGDPGTRPCAAGAAGLGLAPGDGGCLQGWRSGSIRTSPPVASIQAQALIYDALGFRQPAFGHVSLILAPDRSKLSKRHGATAVGDYAGQGYLPAAMRNFLALLGWNDGTERELFSADDLAAAFSLDRVTKSAAVFDVVKLNWMNGRWRVCWAWGWRGLAGTTWPDASRRRSWEEVRLNKNASCLPVLGRL